MNDATRLLMVIGRGDAGAGEALLPLVYDELRRLAAAGLRREPPGQTLSPTDLVHEAYLRLVGPDVPPHWDGRHHFFAAAAEAMRRILVENARRKHRARHGGGRARVPLSDGHRVAPPPSWEVLAVDEVLARFEAEEPEKARLVELRYFAGLSLAEAAEVLGISRATASRQWTYARAWLFDRLTDAENPPTG